jgi:uncharacterized membrane protein
MKKYLITGLVILLPLALTLVIVVFFFNLLTAPFVGVVKSLLGHYGLLDTGFGFLSSDQALQFVSQLIILVLLVFFTLGLGIIARWFFISYILKFWDKIFHRIPLIRPIYKTCQDIIKTIFVSKSKSFKQVVMVPFPNKDTYSIGLVTRDDISGIQKIPEDLLVAVFVPTTPNPTSGFLMMFKTEDLVYLDMKVEDAFKYVISCGVIMPPFKSISKEELLKRPEDRFTQKEVLPTDKI